MQQEVNIPLVELQAVKFPLVPGAFQAANGKMISGFFLLTQGQLTIFSIKQQSICLAKIVTPERLR